MRRSTLSLGILSLLHAADLWCHCEDDEITLLQLNTRVQAETLPSVEGLRAKSALESARQMSHPGAEALLESVRHLARQATSESPEVVNTAIEAVKAALAQMQPKITDEHQLAQLQIQRQLQEIHACHSSEGHGATVVGNLVTEISTIQDCRNSVTRVDEIQRSSCSAWETHANVMNFPTCLTGSGSEPEVVYSHTKDLLDWVNDAWPRMETMRGACLQATETRDDTEASCRPVIDRYDEMYCRHSLSCHLLSACHEHEVLIYISLETDALAGQNSRQEQWRIIMQADCILDLITGAVDTNETVGDASMSSCDDAINVSHLMLEFPEPEHWPAGCPTPSAGDPQCAAIELPRGWDDGAPVLQPTDGVLCVPLLENYQLSNLENSAPALPLNSGSFSYVKAVWKSGRIACDRRYVSDYAWQTCCSSGYTADLGAAFELVINGANVIEQPSWAHSAPQCDQPDSPKGDLICHQPLVVVPSDNFIVTWYETNHRDSLDDNEVDLVVDLFGCSEVAAEPAWHLIAHQAVPAWFPRSARSTFTVNEGDPSASSFMNIGTLTPSDYSADGTYHLRLVYGGVAEERPECNDGPALNGGSQEFEWTQTSWIADDAVTGYEPITADGLDGSPTAGCVFHGLAASSNGMTSIHGPSTVLDGSLDHHHWFDSVGTIQGWSVLNDAGILSDAGIPAFKGGAAQTMSLYIYRQ